MHSMVEWTVDITLDSKAEKSFLSDDCSSVVATDTMKNTVSSGHTHPATCENVIRSSEIPSSFGPQVYVVAKQCKTELSPEAFALRLASHFLSSYEVVRTNKEDQRIQNPSDFCSIHSLLCLSFRRSLDQQFA